MSRLSKKIRHIKKRVEEKVDHIKRDLEKKAPRAVVNIENKISHDARHAVIRATEKAKDILTPVGDAWIWAHEKIPGVRYVEKFLVRSAQRGQYASDPNRWDRISGRVAGAAYGLAETTKVALSRERADTRGLTGKQRRLARAQVAALAATVAVTAGVGAAIAAPAAAGIAGVLGASTTGAVVLPAATAVGVALPAVVLPTVGAVLSTALETAIAYGVNYVASYFTTKYGRAVLKERKEAMGILMPESEGAYVKGYEAGPDVTFESVLGSLGAAPTSVLGGSTTPSGPTATAPAGLPAGGSAPAPAPAGGINVTTLAIYGGLGFLLYKMMR